MNATVDVTTIHIETDRLVLRPWQSADLEDLYAYACVDGVGEMAGWRHHASREVSREILDWFIRGRRTLAIVLKENGRVIGSLGIEPNDNDHVGCWHLGREIGYVLSKSYWGLGLMPEAVNAVCDYCFQHLGYDYLLCGHFLRNHQSRRVIEKCGFRYLKNISHTTSLGTEEDTKLYILWNPKKVR